VVVVVVEVVVVVVAVVVAVVDVMIMVVVMLVAGSQQVFLSFSVHVAPAQFSICALGFSTKPSLQSYLE
jgi:hypothetical protein